MSGRGWLADLAPLIKNEREFEMFGLGRVKVLRVLVVGLGLTVLAACESADTVNKLSALEAKVNTALQNAAAAKVDASTALHMAVDLEDKVK